jgi:hypothetical protein
MAMSSVQTSEKSNERCRSPFDSAPLFIPAKHQSGSPRLEERSVYRPYGILSKSRHGSALFPYPGNRNDEARRIYSTAARHAA